MQGGQHTAFSRSGLASLQGIFYRDQGGFFITMTSKQCSKCKTEKSLDEFCKNRRRKNGLTPQCKSCMYAYRKMYYSKNREQMDEYSKRYNKTNIDIIREQKRIRNKKRMVSDPAYKLSEGLRSRTRCAMLGKQKATTTMELLGCTFEHARAHIESQFTDGMSWNNWSMTGWHIDHIIPCASFDLTDPEQQRQCFHYTNLQPLWAKDNLQKGDKMPHELSTTKRCHGTASTTTK